MRLDAGELVDNGWRIIILQVNTQAKSPGLRDWLRKNSSHAKLATERFDTQAPDEQEESKRVMNNLEKEAKERIAGN